MKKIYLASGWFNPTQAEELTRLEEICDSREWIDLASPRRIFVCPPNAPKETQDATFDGNLHHINTADFLIVNTRDKDIGTIWEAGYAYAFNKHEPRNSADEPLNFSMLSSFVKVKNTKNENEQ